MPPSRSRSLPARRTVAVHAVALSFVVLVLLSITSRPDPTPEFSNASQILGQVAVAVFAGLLYAASVEFARWRLTAPRIDRE